MEARIAKSLKSAGNPVYTDQYEAVWKFKLFFHAELSEIESTANTLKCKLLHSQSAEIIYNTNTHTHCMQTHTHRDTNINKI